MITNNFKPVWNFEKGIYTPPPYNLGLRKRTIIASEYIKTNIGFLIGHHGKFFYYLTAKYNLLYIFYIEGVIEIFGYNDEDIMRAVREIIKKIKYMNYMKYRRKKTKKNSDLITQQQIQ